MRPIGGANFLRVVAVEGRGGQPPGGAEAVGLDGDAVAAGDAAAERGQGRGGVFQAVAAALLVRGEVGGAVHGRSPFSPWIQI